MEKRILRDVYEPDILEPGHLQLSSIIQGNSIYLVDGQKIGDLQGNEDGCLKK
jgi:hypothetical protein